MKKKMIILMAVLAGGWMMMACGSSNKSVTVADLEGEWLIVEVNDTPLVAEESPFLGFNVNEGQLYGSTGCNSLMASFDTSATSDNLSFDAVGSTKRMCADMKTEDAILQALGTVKGFSVEGEKLVLNNADGKELMELKKRP